MLSMVTKDELAMDRGNTGSVYTPEGTGECNQGRERQSQWREKGSEMRGEGNSYKIKWTVENKL